MNASNAQEAARNLESICTVLRAMPDPESHFDKKLIAYTQHALNHVLQLCQKFMLPEKRFDFLVEAWCKCLDFILRLPDGYAFVMGSNWQFSMVLLDVLLRVVDGLMPRPPQAQKQTKDATTLTKDRMSDETRLAALRCLILALPQDKSASTLLDGIADTGYALPDSEDVMNSFGRRLRTNKDTEVQALLLGPKCQSLIGQTVLALLDAAKDANLLSLRTTALEGVRRLIGCLETPERIATWFPGVAAGLTKAMTERGLKEHHSVLCKALEIWTFMIVHVLGGQFPAGPSMEEAVASGASLSATLMDMYKTKAKLTTQPVTATTTTTASMAEGFGSVTWMRKMNHGLQTLFKQVAPLRNHSHWMVRYQFGEMAFRILKDCQNPITIMSGGPSPFGVAAFLLETLIGCTQDEYKDVSTPARSYIGQLTAEYKDMGLTNVGKEILRERLMALSRVLYGIDERVKQGAIRMAQGLTLFIGTQMRSLINHQTLLSYVQPWINVSTVEQLDPHNMEERGGLLDTASTENSIESGNMQEQWRVWVQSHKGSGRKFGFPRRIHLHLREQQTSHAFMAFIRQVGSTTEIDIWTEELISCLQQDSRAVRDNQEWFDSRSVSSVLMLNQLLLGAYGIKLSTIGDTFNPTTAVNSTQKDLDGEKKASSLRRKRQRHVRRAAKSVLDEYLAVLAECSQISADVTARQEATQNAASSAAKNSRTKKLALASLFGMEGEGFDIEQPETVIYDHNTDITLQCLLLEGIASVALVLGGTEFEMELVRVLYVLLEHLGDQDSALVRDTAEATLEHVAFVCHYDSIGDLIQANYDYVIHQVSQRIAFLGSNPKTPQVLWSLIRVVGPPAISMLEDSVTEIFDALDHWKSQEDQIGEGLLKTLCEIVKVMAQVATSSSFAGASEAPREQKRDSGVMMSVGFKFSSSDMASAEVSLFAKTYRIMIQDVESDDEESEKMRKETENMTADQTRDYFMKLSREAKEREENLLGQAEDESGRGESDRDADDDDSMSFGDLRARMPKPSKESKPEPPTKHQALCLRILEKAGYFLTATSPRMRILALETIQDAIIVLKDRPQELNPAIHAFWPSIVGRVLKRSEKDVFFVSLRAIEVVTVLAENCSDFLGRHLLDDVWPFILRVVQTWTKPPSSGSKVARVRDVPSGKKTITSTMESNSTSKHERQQSRKQGRRAGSEKVFTMEHRLQMATLESVSKVVRKVHIPVQQIWEMLLLARDMILDHNMNLHWDVRIAAADVVKSMAVAGHGDSVFVALDEVVQQHEQDRRESGSGKDAEDENDNAVQMCRDIFAFMEEQSL
ncbi:hypothetical protein BGZ54_005620 [Gamsiella multidivaricata]|nr:hypothetical protein BGZ54_005620 [Gamsiella multidivaricata]